MDRIIQSFEETLTYRLFGAFISKILEWLESIGKIGKNLVSAIKYIFAGDVRLKHTIEQSARFGFDSLPITLSMVGVSGMIVALQLAYEMVKQGAGDYVGSLVTVSIIREIGPIMSSFAVISMVGSSMAAEIGTMKVTDQVDALKVLKVNPIAYLIAPRVLAGFLMMPFLVILASVVGIIGGLVTSTIVSELSMLNYIDSVWHGLYEKDIFVCMIKGCVFGGIIAITSSSIGYETEGGAIDVGRSTTKAVVWSFIAVVVADYIISTLFFE